MAAKTPRFVSRTSEDLTSQLTRRGPISVDEETNSSPRARWFRRGRRAEQVPRLVRGITVSDEEKVQVGKAKKLGTFSGVGNHYTFLKGGFGLPRLLHVGSGFRAYHPKCSLNSYVSSVRFRIRTGWDIRNAWYVYPSLMK